MLNEHIIKGGVSSVTDRVWAPLEVFPSHGSQDVGCQRVKSIGTRKMRKPGVFSLNSGGDSKCERKPSLKC